MPAEFTYLYIRFLYIYKTTNVIFVITAREDLIKLKHFMIICII